MVQAEVAPVPELCSDRVVNGSALIAMYSESAARQAR